MPVPERIPLAQPDDRVQRVVLQQEDAPRGDPGRPLGQGRGLIGVVHHAEGVDDQVAGPLVGDRREASLASRPSHEPPWGLGNSMTRFRPDSQPAAARRSTASAACATRASRLGASRLLGHDGFADELRQAARRAQPHLERVGRVGAGSPHAGKWSQAGWLPRSSTRWPDRPAARATGVTAHHGLLSTGMPATLACVTCDSPRHWDRASPRTRDTAEAHRDPSGSTVASDAVPVLRRIRRQVRISSLCVRFRSETGSHVVPVCLPPLRHSASPRPSSTWGCLRCARATSRRTRSTNPRSSIRCTCASARPAFSCSCRPTYRVRRSSPTTPTSRRTRTPGSPTPSGTPTR